MLDHQDWTDRIKNIPTWSKSALGFITLVIGFVVLVRGNIYLGVSILVAIALIAFLLTCTYVAFSKIPPKIEGGKGFYRYEKYRGLALAGIIVSLILLIMGFSVEPSRSFIAVAFNGTSTPTSIPTAISTATPTATPIPSPTSTPSLSSQVYLHSLLVMNGVDGYFVCSNGHVWAFPNDSQTAGLIKEGDLFDLNQSGNLPLAGPVDVYLILETSLPENEHLTIEDIEVTVEQYSPSSRDVTVLALSDICASPLTPEVFGFFNVRLSPNLRQVSLIRPRETHRQTNFPIVANGSPLSFGLHLNTIEPGAYTLSIRVKHFHNGREEVSVLDSPIHMYVPDEQHTTRVFISSWANNGKLELLDNKLQKTFMAGMRQRIEYQLSMSIETPTQNPQVPIEYLRIENIGLEQNLTGWTIKSNDSVYTYTFHSFKLPEFGVVQIWSGSGTDDQRNLYMNAAPVIWGGNPEARFGRSIWLYDKTGDLEAGTGINPVNQ